MNKKMSKVLSGVCSVISLAGIFSISPVKAWDRIDPYMMEQLRKEERTKYLIKRYQNPFVDEDMEYFHRANKVYMKWFFLRFKGVDFMSGLGTSFENDLFWSIIKTRNYIKNKRMDESGNFLDDRDGSIKVLYDFVNSWLESFDVDDEHQEVSVEKVTKISKYVRALRSLWDKSQKLELDMIECEKRRSSMGFIWG